MLYLLVTAANWSGRPECVTSLPSWSWDHELPDQSLAMSVAEIPFRCGVVICPTPMQNDALVHETDDRLMFSSVWAVDHRPRPRPRISSSRPRSFRSGSRRPAGKASGWHRTGRSGRTLDLWTGPRALTMPSRSTSRRLRPPDAARQNDVPGHDTAASDKPGPVG